jgi:hypothetical protein
MALNNNGKNQMLNSLVSVAVYASLHTANPGETGSNEVSGGSYTRKQLVWGTPSNGSVSIINQPVFDVPGGTTVSYVGLWSAASGGTFYGAADVTDESFSGNGTYTLRSFTISIS